jgi:hypothetical protein
MISARVCHGFAYPVGLTPDMVTAIIQGANEEFTLQNNDPSSGRLGFVYNFFLIFDVQEWVNLQLNLLIILRKEFKD